MERKKILIHCPCGKDKEVSMSSYANGRRKYCCLKCRYKYHNAKVPHKFTSQHKDWFEKGETPWNKGKHYSTKKLGTGQGYIDSHGYRIKEEKLEHRLLIERRIGRELSPEEIIHHIDGDKTNNNLDNLVIMFRSEHMKIHKNLRRVK